jgi:PcRGLX-like N-terminal RIFT barrel domain
MSLNPIVITVTDPSVAPFERRREPVRLGVAFPQGVVSAAANWALTSHSGHAVSVQTTIVDRWIDGSVRWLLVDFQADTSSAAASLYTLRVGDAPNESDAIVIVPGDETLEVSTGAATFGVPLKGRGFISSAMVGERPLLRSTGIVAEDAHGTRYEFRVARASVVSHGPVRAIAQVEGAFVDPAGHTWLDGALTLTFHAGLGTVGAEFSVTNSRAARHPGGTWDLGDPGSVLIRDLSIDLVADAAANRAISGSLDASEAMIPAGQRFSVYQDSSGGENWQHITHFNREGRVPVTFRGARAERDGRAIETLRATPIVCIGSETEQISAVMPRFWQMCPKAIAADGERCALGMFPRAYGDLHELQGGERATLQFSLCFGPDTVSAEPLAWARSPLIAVADPVSYQDADAWTSLVVGSPTALDQYDELVRSAVNGDNTFAIRRELIDEYGWRNFGDLYADHEAVKQPLVSHYNNQYDALAGFIVRYLQTGDARWWMLADDLALHVADIDLYHSNRDRAAYSGGHFWHTQHYQPAGTATHRAYSRRSGSSGGGPSAEHNYSSGLMLHYLMTGAERSHAAVLQLADWVIAMDDGSTSLFRWIDRGDTGYASGTRSTDFHGPGRGAGNSINALLDAHRLTNDARYLAKADALVIRCVHPDDDPAARNLLDVENRWSYTIFLQVLGKYLEYRAERGLVDGAFAHARGALLKYATWMAANERPYLDRPETLEFPTETWAAQDLRKAAVLEWAARYTADPAVSKGLLLRAGELFDYSINFLSQSPTGRLTRPIVLMLAYGFQRPAARVTSSAFADDSPTPFGRVEFVPQRRRAMRRLVLAGAALSAALVMALLLLIS